MHPILLSPMRFGKYCEVKLNNRVYRRVVRYSRADGLYVVIATRKLPESKMEIGFNLNEMNQRSD